MPSGKLLDFMLDVFDKFRDDEAVIWHDNQYTYGWLRKRFDYWSKYLEFNKIKPGSVVILEGDFSPNSVALLLALIELRAIIVPLTRAVGAKRGEFIRIAQGELYMSFNNFDEFQIDRIKCRASHELYSRLRDNGHPGLILFSSGSTGMSKAVVHDFSMLLRKFLVRKRKMRIITFLLYDHIGGVNTLLYTLSNGGCIITVEDRSTEHVLSAIERHKAELLPTSPTFLNLILVSEAYKRYNLSSLRTITYGTEPMPENTLAAFHKLFPDIKFQQTYGLSEVGILRSQSRGSDSLWVKVGGEDFATRVVDGILHIKAKSTMLGYLNAPEPFTEDGWFNTGDAVEVDGEWLRILGRKSEIINVGGEKVYPNEVESAIQELDEISEVTVFGEKNPIMGSIVCARVTPTDPNMSTSALKKLPNLIRKHCMERLQKYKVPVKIAISHESQHSERLKKKRS